MSTREHFNPTSPAYKAVGEHGTADIEYFFDAVDSLCAQDRSPLDLENGNQVSASDVIAAFEEVIESVAAADNRHYLDDMAKYINRFNDWRTNPNTEIHDGFYGLFAEQDLYGAFSEWASQTSKYYPAASKNDSSTPNALETRIAEAEEDLRTAVLELKEIPLFSKDIADPWSRGEDAFYYLLGNALTPSTPEKTWQSYSAFGAYIFAVDNQRHNEARRRDGLKFLKRTEGEEGSLTDRERERLVKFEGRYPGSRGSELSFALDHRAESLPYGPQLSSYFGRSVYYFDALLHKQAYAIEPAS